MRFEKRSPAIAAAAAQLREGGQHPFGILDRYVPLDNAQIPLYRAVREAVPIVDAALSKLVRLVGGVTVICRDVAAQDGLDAFLMEVDTGRGQRGLQSFLDGYLDAMLTCGRAVGELVLDREGRSPPSCAGTPPFWRFGRGIPPWISSCAPGIRAGRYSRCPTLSCCSLPPSSPRRTVRMGSPSCGPCPSSRRSF